MQSRKCRRPWRRASPHGRKAWLGLGRPGGHVLGRHLRPRLRMESGFSVERCRFFGRRWVGPGHTATPRPALESGLRGRFLQGAVLPKSSPGHVSSAPERPGLRSCYSRVVRGTGLRGAAGRPATDREMEGRASTGAARQPAARFTGRIATSTTAPTQDGGSAHPQEALGSGRRPSGSSEQGCWLNTLQGPGRPQPGTSLAGHLTERSSRVLSTRSEGADGSVPFHR